MRNLYVPAKVRRKPKGDTMKYCSNCGTPCEDDERFCHNCGARLAVTEESASPDTSETRETSENTENRETEAKTAANAVIADAPGPDSGSEQDFQQNWNDNSQNQGNFQTNGTPSRHPEIKQRSIVLAIVFSIITCGIYSIYWMIVLNDDINSAANDPEATSGIMVFLFSLITCGIYGIYWNYKMGEKVDKIKNDPNGSSKFLFLILSICGLSIVSFAMMQDTLNRFANGEYNNTIDMR